jgi:hypothetical protein
MWNRNLPDEISPFTSSYQKIRPPPRPNFLSNRRVRGLRVGHYHLSQGLGLHVRHWNDGRNLRALISLHVVDDNGESFGVIPNPRISEKIWFPRRVIVVLQGVHVHVAVKENGLSVRNSEHKQGQGTGAGPSVEKAIFDPPVRRGPSIPRKPPRLDRQET